MYHKVLSDEQKEYIRKLIFEDKILDYDKIVELVGGPRPPIRLAIKQLPGVLRIETCPECGKDTIITHWNKQQKFCCNEHKKKYYNTHRKKTKLTVCENCGKEFYQYSFRNSRFCSCSCAAGHREDLKKQKQDLDDK